MRVLRWNLANMRDPLEYSKDSPHRRRSSMGWQRERRRGESRVSSLSNANVLGVLRTYRSGLLSTVRDTFFEISSPCFLSTADKITERPSNMSQESCTRAKVSCPPRFLRSKTFRVDKFSFSGVIRVLEM